MKNTIVTGSLIIFSDGFVWKRLSRKAAEALWNSVISHELELYWVRTDDESEAAIERFKDMERAFECGDYVCIEVGKLPYNMTFGYIRNLQEISSQAISRLTDTKDWSRYVDGKYQYKDRHSKILLENNNCPLTGVCYDQDILDPIIRYYKTWNSYPEDFSWPDLMRQCYDNFFKSWHEEYEYWADDESALREELHNNQYEDRLYYKNGDVYVGQLNEIA